MLLGVGGVAMLVGSDVELLAVTGSDLPVVAWFFDLVVDLGVLAGVLLAVVVAAE